MTCNGKLIKCKQNISVLIWGQQHLGKHMLAGRPTHVNENEMNFISVHVNVNEFMQMKIMLLDTSPSLYTFSFICKTA